MYRITMAVREGVLKRGAFLFLLLCLTTLPACAAQKAEDAHLSSGADIGNVSSHGLIAPEWQHLQKRLAADGLAGPEVDSLLASLGPKSSAPMGRKMTELYKKNFLPSPTPPKKPSADVYKGVVTAKNADKCLAFIQKHKGAFARAEKKYGVEPSVACALLFVETRLGAYLGAKGDNALQTLASMAESREKSDIADWLGRMPGHEEHETWFAQTMRKRSEWAYRETRALVRYMVDNRIIAPYGADGNGDGIVNLYTPEDAVASLANYLAKHGWKKNGSRALKHRVLMRYNKSTRYANTILELASLTAKRAGKTR